MSEFTCPNCRGGFPSGPANDGCCPWCGQSLDGSYEPPERSVAVKKTVEKDETENKRLFSLFR
jgi:DNA repair exonuclease SbcCD ATPase subunit